MKNYLMVTVLFGFCLSVQAKMKIKEHTPSKNKIIVQGNIKKVKVGDVLAVDTNCEYEVTKIRRGKVYAKRSACADKSVVVKGEWVEIAMGSTSSSKKNGSYNKLSTSQSVISPVKRNGFNLAFEYKTFGIKESADTKEINFGGISIGMGYRVNRYFETSLKYSNIVDSVDVSNGFLYDTVTVGIRGLDLGAQGIYPLNDNFNLYGAYDIGLGKQVYVEGLDEAEIDIDTNTLAIGMELFFGQTKRHILKVEFGTSSFEVDGHTENGSHTLLGYGLFL